MSDPEEQAGLTGAEFSAILTPACGCLAVFSPPHGTRRAPTTRCTSAGGDAMSATSGFSRTWMDRFCRGRMYSIDRTRRVGPSATNAHPTGILVRFVSSDDSSLRRNGAHHVAELWSAASPWQGHPAILPPLPRPAKSDDPSAYETPSTLPQHAAHSAFHSATPQSVHRSPGERPGSDANTSHGSSPLRPRDAACEAPGGGSALAGDVRRLDDRYRAAARPAAQ